MRIDIATLFPEMCEAVLCESIIGRAREAGLLEVYCHNIRDYTQDKHRRVDDTPYGGGMGMVMQADPIFRCYEAVCAQLPQKPHVIYLSPQGKVLTQQMAVEYSRQQYLFLLCGHYEGVDERVLEEIVDEELSIGDYVLTGRRKLLYGGKPFQRPFGVPAVFPAGGLAWKRGAGGSAQRASRQHLPLAAGAVAVAHPGQTAGPVGDGCAGRW